jgi:hypothetical protein
LPLSGGLEVVANRALRFGGVVLLVLSVLGIVARADTIVYDNTKTPTDGNYTDELKQGFWPFSVFTPYEFMGDLVTLAGTDRTVSQFVLKLKSSQATTLGSVTVQFYNLKDGLPDDNDVIWQHIEPSVYVEVPDVTVDDSFAWAASSDSMVAGLATFNPPTIGSSEDYYLDRDTGTLQWYTLGFEGDPIANFGARVVATPEPATLATLLPPGAIAVLRRRRRLDRA